MKPTISVILTTYNAEAWLEKVLIGFAQQTFKDFELIVADDGSGPKTKALIDRLSQEVFYPIIHVWHRDNGFQKTKILNKAIVKANGDYLVFTDGDCIPRKDFLNVHHLKKQNGFFLSGGYFKLPMDLSRSIQNDDISSQKCFDHSWLLKNGLPFKFKNLKLTARGFFAKLMNFLTPTKPTWNGHNASGWKSDLIEVNGYDERMQWGGLDRELGERLVNSGIKGKQIRYAAICIHLDHKRGYKNQESIAANWKIRNEVKLKKKTRTEFGIVSA